MKFKLHPNLSTSDINLIIDGKYLAYRTKYTPTFKLSYGDAHTGLAYGVLNTLRQLGKKFNPINVVFMWDNTPLNRNKRKIQFTGYKNRDNFSNLTPEEIKDRETFFLAYQVLMADLNLLGFAGYALEGYEADDLIALWCERFNKRGTNVIITRDEDMFQCINKNTEIYNVDDKFFRTLDWFKKTYDIDPPVWPLVKAIGGCKSDTIPGVPGIGEATALKYLKGGASPKQIEKIRAYVDKINLYQKLTILPHWDLREYHIPFKYTDLDMGAFISFCQQNGYKQFIENINDFQIFNKGEQQ